MTRKSRHLCLSGQYRHSSIHKAFSQRAMNRQRVKVDIFGKRSFWNFQSNSGFHSRFQSCDPNRAAGMTACITRQQQCIVSIHLFYDVCVICQVTPCPGAAMFPMRPPGQGVRPAPPGSQGQSWLPEVQPRTSHHIYGELSPAPPHYPLPVFPATH